MGVGGIGGIGGIGGAPTLSQPPELSQPPTLSLPPEASAPPGMAGPGPDSACQAGMAKFTSKREAQMASINALAKAGKGKPMDATAACPRFRALAVTEAQMKAWVLKNKDGCGIPDQIVEQMTTAFAKTPQFAQRACAFAAQAKKQMEMQAQGGGAGAQPQVKLPAGPL